MYLVGHTNFADLDAHEEDGSYEEAGEKGDPIFFFFFLRDEGCHKWLRQGHEGRPEDAEKCGQGWPGQGRETAKHGC